MPELDQQTLSAIKDLCAAGGSLAEQKQYPEALDAYWDAFDLMPPPQTQWEAATWVLAAIADANFLGEDYEAGRDNFSVALRCPGGLGNPFLHLRLGQCQFELGDLRRAADELTRAYMGDGLAVFEGQDEKYLTFLKTRLREPEGGW